MDLNSKLVYFLKNGPSEAAKALSDMLNQVNEFTKDVTHDDLTIGNCDRLHYCSPSLLDVHDDGKINKVGLNDNGVENRKKINDGQVQPSGFNGKDSQINLEANEKAAAIEIEKINDESETSNSEHIANLSNLRQPLTEGWRRETYVSIVGRDSRIQGRVSYYGPGSRVELKDIGQVQMALARQTSHLSAENFSFSTRHIVGTFLQPFKSLSDGQYFYRSEAQMEKCSNEHKRLRSILETRKKKRSTNRSHERVSGNSNGSDGDEMKDTIEKSNESANENISFENMETIDKVNEKEHTTTDNDSEEDLSDRPESLPSKFELEIKLTKVDDGETYYDTRGYLYSKNNSRQIQNLYFRCKNSKRYGCPARAKASGNNVEKTILTRQHNHLPREEKVDKEKFDKQLGKACIESPYSYPRELYNKVRKSMNSKINPDNIPLKRKYDTLIQKKKRRFIPKLPKSVDEFEHFIEGYKKQYFYDERDLPFYRKVWKRKTGEAKLKQMKVDIRLLMDGTFKVLPRHIKFRQLYIISAIVEERCYPLAFILMEKKTQTSYQLIFERLKLLMGQCEVTNVMSDYEAATRKALKIEFPLARISGCYFHYVQAINKASRRFGLSEDDKFQSAIQKVSALALLPNEFISEGFSSIDIENRTFKYSLRWGRFKKYWHRQWRKANISVYGLIDRTNNFAESMNKSLNLLAKVRHPNIWILIEHIKTLEMNKTNELKKHEKGEIFQIEKSGEMGWLNDQITYATEIFKRKQNVEKFLRNITSGDRLENFFKERIYLDDVDEFDSEEDSGFEEDLSDFIPNDFDVTCNFSWKPSAESGKMKRKAEATETISKKRRRVEYV